MEPHRSTSRRAAALAIGSLTTQGLSLVQAAASVPGWLVGVVGVAALVALPVSRECSRRLAIVLIVVLGWAPLLWLLQWPTGDLTRFGGMTAVVVGGLVAWVALGPVRARVAALVPRFRRADGVALVGIGLVLAYLAPLLRIRSYPDAVGVVLGGWDHVGHYDMARMIVHGGRLIPFLPPGESGPWYYDSYPQGLHSSVAMLMELSQGIGGGSGIGEVAAYLQATTIVYAATLAAVICAGCAVPAVRRRPGRAALGMVALVVAWLVSPGGGIMHQSGFDNFVLATAGVACVPLLLAGVKRIGLAGPTLGASGALMAVAHNWLLLLPMGGIALLVAMWPLRRGRLPTSWAGRWALALFIVCTAGGVLSALVQVLSARGADHLLVEGGFPTHNLAGYVVPIVVALVAIMLIRGSTGWAIGGAAVLAGLLLFAAVAGAQLLRLGQISYYGIKLLTAVMLVALTTLVVLLATAAPTRFAHRRLGRHGPGAALALALLICSVLPFVRQRDEFPSVRVRLAWSAGATTDASADTRMLERMLAVPTAGGVSLFLPSATADSGTVAHLNLWQFAIRGTWTQRADACWRGMWKAGGPAVAGWTDRTDLAAAVGDVVRCGPGITPVVPQGGSLVQTPVPSLTSPIPAWVASG